MGYYRYRCPDGHGEFETRRGMLDAQLAIDFCPECDRISLRVYNRSTAPTTDIKSFGRNLHSARTPAWQWRAKSDLEEQQIRGYARDEGARRQYGPGRTTGS